MDILEFSYKKPAQKQKQFKRGDRVLRLSMQDTGTVMKDELFGVVSVLIDSHGLFDSRLRKIRADNLVLLWP